jgi:nucleoside-diphosphate-sugar epimerase
MRDALADRDAVVDTYALTGADAAAAVTVAATSARLVVLSSCDVYRAYSSLQAGTVTDAVPLAEDAPLRTERYPYRGKLEGMDDYDKLDVEEAYLARGGTVARLGFVIGVHDRQRREEPILRRIRACRRALPIGTANFVGSRVLVDDVARGVTQLLATPADRVNGEVFNLVETASPSLALWARWIAEDANAELELIRVADDRLPADLALHGYVAQSMHCSAEKAVTSFGWSPADPREATRRSVAWHLVNPPVDVDNDFSADDEALASVR